MADREEAVTAKTDAYQASITLFTDIPVDV